MVSKPKEKFKNQPFRIEKMYHYQRFLKKKERSKKNEGSSEKLS